MNEPERSGATAVEGAVISPDHAVALLGFARRLMRRLTARDTVLLTLHGASIPAAWVALWFVLSNLVPTE